MKDCGDGVIHASTVMSRVRTRNGQGLLNCCAGAVLAFTRIFLSLMYV